jgi:hypothetical protein
MKKKKRKKKGIKPLKSWRCRQLFKFFFFFRKKKKGHKKACCQPKKTQKGFEPLLLLSAAGTQ